ncbi:ATP-binding protein [Streptomyces sp. NPDC058964]|uniref:ATP-binding protein n=1 Tax=Streptomyces sp. NPDC058964 TaxID=3346681 RepID=UPI00368C167B
MATCEDDVVNPVHGGDRLPVGVCRPGAGARGAVSVVASPVRGVAPPRQAKDGVAARAGIVPCDPRSAALARDLVARRLAALCLADLVDVAELLVSELVGNAIKYAGGRTLLITVHAAERGARVTVTDGSRGLPTLVRAGGEDEGGRGLALVDALALRWGTVPLRNGKRVWFEL